MHIAALIVGLVIVAQGVVGLVAPEFFFRLIQFIQAPPYLYVAALLRIGFGVVLVLAAPASRAPVALRILGAVIVVGGVLTPFFGVRLASIILDWWSQGPGIVRALAAAALLLGALIAYAVRYPSRAA